MLYVGKEGTLHLKKKKKKHSGFIFFLPVNGHSMWEYL